MEDGVHIYQMARLGFVQVIDSNWYYWIKIILNMPTLVINDSARNVLGK